jgi:hypothetical protein
LRKFSYIKQIPDRGANLSDHVRITESGREFVRLREEMKGELEPGSE